VNAPADRQLRLLDVQAADADLARLVHRRRTLPELAVIEDLDERLSRLEDATAAASTEDDDLAKDQRRLEADVDLVRSRAERDRQRLDSGAVGSPRELENLQSELTSLRRRQNDLEEQVLAVMEAREDVQARIASVSAEGRQLAAERAAAAERCASSQEEIDRSTALRTAERARLVQEIPADLLSLYEKVRADMGGVGAAALQRGRCEGCHLSLSGQDISMLRSAPPDLVIRCEECRRILVRTPESGL
jgi:uncharacterized protein